MATYPRRPRKATVPRSCPLIVGRAVHNDATRVADVLKNTVPRVGTTPRIAAGSIVACSWLRLFRCPRTQISWHPKLATLDIGSHSNAGRQRLSETGGSGHWRQSAAAPRPTRIWQGHGASLSATWLWHSSPPVTIPLSCGGVKEAFTDESYPFSTD